MQYDGKAKYFSSLVMNNNKTQIALVCTFYNSNGGISSYVKGVEKALRHKNLSTAIISPDVITKMEFCHSKVNGKTHFVILLSCFFVLLKTKPMQVHCHGAWYLVVSCILYKWFCTCLFKAVPVAAIKHTDIQFETRSFKAWVLRWIDRFCDRLVFVSHRSKKLYLATNPEFDKSRIEVIWPGIEDIALEKTAVNPFQQFLGGEFHAAVITYMGLMEYPKKVEGLFRLLQAFQIVRRKFPNIKLLIAGRGGLEKQVDKVIVEYGLENSAIRVGEVTNRADFFSISNLHCHISFQDTFSIVILEALACGVNVIINDIGDFKEINLAGIRICNDHAENIAQEIIYMLDNPVTVDTQLVLSAMSWDNCAAKFMRLF